MLLHAQPAKASVQTTQPVNVHCASTEVPEPWDGMLVPRVHPSWYRLLVRGPQLRIWVPLSTRLTELETKRAFALFSAPPLLYREVEATG